MAELQHDRTPEQIATRTFALDGREFPATAAVLAARLITLNERNPPKDQLLNDSDPVVSLAVDMLAASGGNLYRVADNSLLVTFDDVSTAVLASRRLQWAFQGLSEIDIFAGKAVAIIVHSGHDLPINSTSEAIALGIAQAAPGQVLLAGRAIRFVEDLPCLPLRPTNDPSLYELLIHRLEIGSGIAVDERALFRNITGQGRVESFDQIAQPPEPSQIPSVEASAVDPSPESFKMAGSDRRFSGLSSGSGLPHRMLWTGGAALLLIAISLGWLGISRHRSAPKELGPVVVLPIPTGEPKTSGTKTSPEGTIPGTKTSPEGTISGTKISPEGTTSEIKTSQDGSIEQEKPPQKTPAGTKLDQIGILPGKLRGDRPKNEARGNCAVGEAGASDTLKRAQANLHGGNQQDAERQFRSVLGCPGLNEAAQDGLRELKNRKSDPM